MKTKSPIFCWLLWLIGFGGLAPGATITWINSSGGNWSVATNWIPNQVPGASDTADISLGGNYTVTLDASASVAGLALGASSGGSTQTFLMNGQTLTLNGPAVVSPQGFFNFNNGMLAGTNVWVGAITWSGGIIGPESILTIATNGVLNIGGSGTLYLEGAITNAGTVNWTGSTLQIYNDNGGYGYTGGLNNLAGAVFNILSDQTMANHFGPEYFNNAGILHKSGTVNTTTIAAIFNNTGAVDVQSGTVNLAGGGTGGAQFTVEAGATLDFSDGYTQTSDGVFSGAGSNLLTGGTITINGLVTTTNSLLAGATLTGTGSFGGPLTWTSGIIGGGSTLTIATNGELNLSGNGTLYLEGALTNAGTVNWTGSTLQIYNDNGGYGYTGGLNNLPGAVFNILSDQTMANHFGPEYFNNAGIVRKSGAVNTTTIAAIFNNTGAVDVQSGTVNLAGGGTGGAQFTVEAGATLGFSDGFTQTSDGVFNGAGSNLLIGGTITINGLVTTTNTVLAGATLTGGGTLSGLLTWTSGIIGGGSTLTIATNGELNLSGNGTLYLEGALTNAGTVNWTGSTLQIYNDNGGYGYTGGINNLPGAVFNIQSDQRIANNFGPEYFNNAGLVRKSGAVNTTTINAIFNNTGTVDVQSGILNLDYGGAGSAQFQTEAGGTLAIGAGYSATATSVFGGAGTNWLTGGIITINGLVTTTNTVLAGATLAGGGTFSGLLTWTSGAIGGGSTLTIATNGVWNLNSSGTLYLGGALTNAGTLNWVAGAWQIYNDNGGYGYTGGLNNLPGAVVNILNDQAMNNNFGPEYFNNAGLVRKWPTTGTTTLNVAFNNSGTVDVESGLVNCSYSHNLAGGILNFGITSVTNYGQVTLANAAALAGTLAVHVNAGYAPAASNSFALVSYGSETGSFTNINLPAYLNWQTNYGPSAFSVTAGFPPSALGWLALGYTTNGTYTIDPSGSGPFAITTLMSLAGGGWTELTAPVADSVLNTNIGTSRDYLYVQNGTSDYYRTTASTLVWSWTSGQDLDGTYYYSTGSGESSFTITPSSEHPAYGVGGSSGPGTTDKCLVLSSSCLDASNAQVQLCQDQPGIFGSGCQCGVTVYIRENGPVVLPAPPLITSQPAGQLAALGGNASFTASAAGAVPLNYQWFFNQTNLLTGATNATLLLANLSYPQAGAYAVIVTNIYGSVISTPAVLQIIPVLTWANPPAILYGTTLGSSQLDANATLPGTFVYNPPAGSALSAGTNELSVMFTPSNTVDFAVAAGMASLVVTPAPLSVTASNATRLAGQANPAFTGILTGVVNGDNLTASYGSPATPSSPVGTYPIIPALVDPNGRLGNYTVTTNDGTLTVYPTTLSVNWTAPAPIIYGTALSGGQLDASANLPGAYAYSPGAGAQLNAGTNLLTLVFTPNDLVDFTSATSHISLVVQPAPLVVTASNSARLYGQTNPVLNGIIIGAVNGDTFTATYATTATTNSVVGVYPITPFLVDPDNRLENYTVTTNNGTLTVNGLMPQLTWAIPAPIPYGTALSSTQLDANASVPGSPDYFPAAGTVLNAGTNILTVVFTPTQTTVYSSVTDSVSLLVTPAPLSVKANNAARTYGQANPAFTGTLSGVINGDNITAVFNCSAVSFSPPGNYPIMPSLVDPGNRLGNYTVATTNGTLTVSAGPPPTFLALTPNTGLTNGGTSVTLIGSGFELGAAVYFGGQPAASAVVNSGTQITAVTPPGPLGLVSVTVTNPDNSTITLTNSFTYIGPPPAIVTQPASQVVSQGGNAVFSVSAPGATGWQWLFDGASLTDNGRITGSHAAVLTVPDAQTADAGNYEVIVNNAWGATRSAVATLAIISPPGILAPPQNQTVGQGGTALFSVSASGTAPFAYQWLVGGTPVPGATNAALVINNVPLSDQGQQYRVRVSNPAGYVTSPAAALTVLNYCASAQPGQSVYPMGSPVPLTVQTFNCSSQVAVPNSVAIAWISMGGTLRSLPVTTGSTGSTTVNFVPLPTEFGTYQVAAALPGQSLSAVQGTFSLVGMSLSRNQIASVLTPGLPLTNTITLSNLTSIPLNGLTATVLGSPADVQVTLNAPTTLAGNAGSPLTLVMVAPANNAAQDQFSVQLTTAQGTTNVIYVTANVSPLLPQLVTTPAALSGTMVGGGQTLINFSVANTGGAASGPVQVLLPSVPWLSTVTPLPLPSLAPGQSNQVTLALTPATSLPVGNYPGTLVLISSNADLPVPFQFACVSALTGVLQVTVQDELSYYGTGTPNVSNATVTVTDYLTGAAVTNAVTDASGILLFTNLISAYYTVAVTAPDHGNFSTTLLVAANQTNDLTAFLALQLVDYTWVVTPTIIPDHYTFTLDTTFQTQVPWPVVTVSPGAIDLCALQGDTNQINLTITNSGLISAMGLTLYFGSHPDWFIQPLVTSLGDLAPQSSIVVPLTISRIGSATGVPDSITAQLSYSVTTPTQTHSAIVPIYVYDANPADCEPAAPTPPPVVTVCNTCGVPPGGGGGGGGGEAGGGGSGGGSGGGGSGQVVLPTIQPPNYSFQTPQGAIVQVKLQIQQSAVIARDAFNASLQLVNGAGAAISNLTASITVYDASNNVANNLFGIPAPALNGLNAVDGTGMLANGATGSAAWTIVPATNAAPTAPVQFSVGGSFSYILNGEPVTIPLFPVPITVLPTPILNVDYFLQHDVYSDDPFTLPIEPAIPFALGLRVNNIGHGNAYDFSITSAQPQIIQNSNDLLIAFQLIGSQVGTNPVSPSFTLDLGDIGPLGSAEGLWYLTSTLEGQFIAFSATYQHVDDFGNTNTSLINQVNIHELNHVVELTEPADDGLPDFLVNDTTNVDAPPGIVYSSEGTTAPVTSVLANGFTVGAPSASNATVSLTVPATTGWAYYEVIDPGNDNYPIASVTRSDGVKLLVGPNVWQTPQRLHMLPPKPNNLIHLFDHDSTGSYTVTYGLPVLAPAVTTLAAVNLTPTNATLNALVNPNGADTDVYFQWGATTNYGNMTSASTLTGSLNTAQAVTLAIGGLLPNRTNHFRAVGVNSAGTTFGADVAFVTLPLLPPVINQVSNQITSVGQGVVIATHVQVATPPALYSLDPSDPEGSSISTNGVFKWTPACLQGSTTNLITIWVTDSSTPPLSNFMTFSVVVDQCVQLELGSTVMQVGTTSGVPVTLLSTVGLTNLNWKLSNPAGRLTNWVFASSNAAIASVNSTQTFFNLNALAGQALQSPALLGTVFFQALPGPSAFLTLVASNIVGTKLDGSTAGNAASLPGRVVVIGSQPLLEPLLGTNGTRTLVLYDNPGTNFQLMVYTNLTSTNWQSGGSGTITNLMEFFPVNPSAPELFFRVK